MSGAHTTLAPPPREAQATARAGTASIRLRAGERRDLDRVNAVIAAAMDTWGLPERVKRLSLPLYRYAAQDLEHLDLVVAETAGGCIVGVAAIEAADTPDRAHGHNPALLHGLYVEPRHHGQGIGGRLMAHTSKLAVSRRFDTLLVRARQQAASFFEAHGLRRVDAIDAARDYPWRYVLDLPTGG